MTTTTRTYPAGEIRVSDADRDAAVAELSEHYQAGRLTTEEFEDRTGRALSARTGKDLAALLADLPAGGLAHRPEAEVSRPPRAGRLPVNTTVVIAAIAAIVIASSVLGRHGTVVISLWPAVIGYLVFRRLVRCRRRT